MKREDGFNEAIFEICGNERIWRGWRHTFEHENDQIQGRLGQIRRRGSVRVRVHMGPEKGRNRAKAGSRESERSDVHTTGQKQSTSIGGRLFGRLVAFV